MRGYFFSFFFVLTPVSTMADISWEQVESICSPASKFQYQAIHSGMTVAEIEALSESKPYYAPDNDFGSLELSNSETIIWDTDDTNTANIKNQTLYKIGYNLKFSPSNTNWLEDKSVKLYQDILSAYGEPKENKGPSQNNKRWKIVYGPKEKMITAPDSLWIKFMNACKTEAGSSSGEFSANAGHLMNMDYNFFEVYQETAGMCPNALGKEYWDFLEDFFQPTVAFQALYDNFSMSTNCPMVVRWSYLQNLKKSNGQK